MKKVKPTFPPRSPSPPPLSLRQSPTTTNTRKPNSFNATITRFSAEGAHRETLLTFFSMLKSRTPPDAYTFPSLFKACASLGLFRHSISLHRAVIVSGYSSDSYVASSLINSYAKFGYVSHARKVFDMMPERDVVPWTSIIRCYSRSSDIDSALSLFISMRLEGVEPNSVTLLDLLTGVLEVAHLQILHACSIRYGFESYTPLSNSFLNVYCKCGRVDEARFLFGFMKDGRDIVSWNTLIAGYAQQENVNGMLQLLYRMKNEGLEPDQKTYVSLVSATAARSNLALGKVVHGQILTSGYKLDAHVETSLVVMYLKCGTIVDAFRVFEQATVKDVILWTAMISGLVQNDCADKALSVFHWMLSSGQNPSGATIASALAACAQMGSFFIGISIHGHILRHRMVLDVAAQNSLLTMYAKCNHLEQSRAVFDRMSERDVVSWNAIVAAHAQNGHLFEALCLFDKMRMTLLKPDSITVLSLLQSCASAGALHQGKCIHNVVIRSFLGPSILVETALVDMYCKCGTLDIAQKCFDRMSQPDLISWSTIIAGYGSHGHTEAALRLYSRFLQTGIKPNDVLFLSILSACSHNGLISQGLSLYQSMILEFGIEPRLEHRACIVDLLARAGRVVEAYNFYKMAFAEPNIDVLGILLDGCRTRGNAELGGIISNEILTLRPVSAENFVQLARNYASMSRWDGVGQAWTQMKSLGLKKLPGWSFIELQGTITTFFVGHTSHLQCEDMAIILKLLGYEMDIMGAKPIPYCPQYTLENSNP